jgi:hypothetical protein
MASAGMLRQGSAGLPFRGFQKASAAGGITADMWGNDKPEQKRQGHEGEGWLRSPDGSQVVRITSASETLHAKWVEVTDADITRDSRALVRHSRRMLRFNAVQLWQNLIRLYWRRVPPQW